MTAILVLLASVVLQLLAALLAVQLIRVTRHRTAWVLIAAASVLMILRRVIPLVGPEPYASFPRPDLYEIAGLVVSALLLGGLVFVRRYLYDTFAAEHAVRDSEQRYRSLAENIPDGAVFLFDRSHRYTLAAGPALADMDLPSDELPGELIADVDSPALWAQLFGPMHEQALSGASCRAEQPYNGKVFAVQFAPVHNVKGEVDQTLAVVQDISHKVKAEQERKAAYDFLQHTIDGVAEPVMVIGLDYSVELANRVVRETYGDWAGGMAPRCFQLSHHRQTPCSDRLRHPCPLEKVRESLLPVTVQHDHLNAHGEVRNLDVVASPLFDEHGNLQGIIESCHDVTERNRAEQGLRRSERIFRSFLEQAEDAILLTNEEGQVIAWSKGAEALTGYTREGTVGHMLWDVQFRSSPDELKTPETHAAMQQLIQSQLATGQGGAVGSLAERLLQRPSGERRVVQTRTFLVETDKGFLLASILRDLTGLKQTEREVMRLRKAVDASGEVVFMTDRNGIITFVNPEFTRLYGYTAEDVVGRATPRILKSGKMPHEAYAEFWRTILAGQATRGEIINRTKDGRLLTIESSANPIIGENGQIDGFLAIQRDVTERKRAEQERENSEKRLRALVENGVDCISLVDAAGRLLWESPSASRTMGYSPAGRTGSDAWGAAHPDDALWMQEHFAALVAQPGAQERSTFRIQHQDGSWRWVDAVVTNLLAEPSVQAMVVNYHDVTQRKQAEHERTRLLSAIENSLDGIAIADENDRFIYDNRAHAQTHGYEEGELIGQTWRVLVPPEAVVPIEEAFAKELRNKEIGYVVTTATGLKKDGTSVPIEFRANALWDDNGEYAGHICHVFDVSARLEAEAATRRRTEELEALARVSAGMRTARTEDEIFRSVVRQVAVLFGCEGAALAMFDADGEHSTVKLGYGAWESWTGRRYNASMGMMGRESAGHIHSADGAEQDSLFHWDVDSSSALHNACVPLVTNRNMIGLMYLGRRPEFSDKDLGLLTAIADMAANALQRQALHEDLQARLKDLQEAQTHIIQSEKLAAIGQLVSGIAHELNNPLTSVVLYAQMLQRRFDDAEARRDLDQIVSESLRASKIVRGLLDFARQRPPENQPVNVNDILRSAMDLVAYELRAHDVRQHLELDPDVPIMQADAHQLQQVFVNLANNAWQAISSVRPGGNLWITTQLVGAAGQGSSRSIRITFRDDGPGIPKAQLASVFDPFFTTKPEGSGTGLGLSICYGIISKHGGTIRVESEDGQGAVMTIELPIVGAAEPAHSAGLTAAGRNDDAPHAHVLIIDDEESVLAVLARALRGRGYSVDALNDAAEALGKLATASYTAVLCDIRMPGLSGPQFYREVRQRHPEYVNRIVFITGDVVSAGTRTFIDEERIECLAKPFELDQLYQIVERMDAKC